MKNGRPLNKEQIQTAEQVPLFSNMDDKALNKLWSEAFLMNCEKSEVLMAQGSAVTHFFVILQGWAGISRGLPDGQESILQIFGRNDFLPEISVLENKVSPWSVRVFTSAQILTISAEAVLECLRDSPAFTQAMLNDAARRSQALMERIEQLTLRTAEERVGRFLLKLRLQTVPGEKEILLPFDKALIANFLGIKPETLSRVLQSFREHGFTTERQLIGMPHNEALCDFCDMTSAKMCRHNNTSECPNPLVETF